MEGVIPRILPLVRRRHAVRPELVVAGAILLLFALAASLAPWLAPHDPNAQDLLRRYEPANLDALLGTDRFGRDTLSRLLFGLRPTIVIAGGAVAVAATVGALLGMYAGYHGGWLDLTVGRGVDMLMSFPVLLLALVVIAALGSSVLNVLIAIALAFLPGFIRLARNPTLSVRRAEFVEAARCIGVSDNGVVLRHVFPNVRPAIFTFAVIAAADAIVLESSLTFLGVGLQPPDASLGSMIREAFNDLHRSMWLTASSGGALFVLVLALNVTGDVLQAMIAHRPH